MAKSTTVANVTKSVKATAANAASKLTVAADKAADKAKAKLAAARAEVEEIRAKRAEAEQQAAAERARAEQALADLEAHRAANPDYRSDAQGRIMSAVDMLMEGYEFPSWKRIVCGVIAGIIVAAGAGLLIGLIGSYAIAGVLALTGSAVLAWCVYILTLIISFFVGGKVGSKVGGYVISGDIDRHASAAKNKVLGWFKAKPEVQIVEAQFTGAHTPA
jgi:hypothetical protein